MTALVAVTAPGDQLARPGNHPKENTVTGKPYTEADVKLVAQTLWDQCGVPEGMPPASVCFDDAIVVLSNLAAAGRLLPDGSWAVPKVPIEHEGWLTADGRVVSMVFDANQDTLSPAEAREFAACYLAAADAAEARRD